MGSYARPSTLAEALNLMAPGDKRLLAGGTDLYPEISGSHHRCSVRFLVWQDANTRPIQTTEDVRFTLTTCT